MSLRINMKIIYILFLLLLPFLVFATELDDFNIAVEQMNDGYYTTSISSFLQLSNKAGSSEIKEKSLILLGESYLRKNDLKNTFKTFNKYINMYPAGKHIPFAYSRLGIVEYQRGNYENGINYLNLALEFKNISYRVDLSVFLADCYKQLGDYKKAIYSLEQMIKLVKDENLDQVYIKLAEIESEIGNNKKAISYINKVTGNPKSQFYYKANYIAGNILFNMSFYENAVKYLNRNAKSDNDYKYPSIYLLGEIHVIHGNYFTAEQLFNKLSNTSMYKYPGIFGNGWVAFERGNYTDALNNFDKIPSKASIYKDVIFYKALCYKKMNDEERFFIYADSLKHFTSDRSLIKKIEYEKFDYYLSASRFIEAKEELNNLKKTDKLYYQYSKGLLLYKRGKYSDALIILKSLVNSSELRDFTGNIKYRIILCNFKLKKYNKSIELINKWDKQLKYYNNEITLLKGDIYLKSGKYNKVVNTLANYYKKAKEPYKEIALRTIAWAYYKARNYGNSYTKFKEFTKHYPNSKYINEAYLELGNCAYNLNRKQEALSYYKMVKGKDEIQKAIFRQGKIFYEKREYSEAIQLLRSFIDKYPASSVADDALLYVALSFYNMNQPDSSEISAKKILTNYKNSNRYFDALIILGDISFNNNRYEKMQSYFSDIIKNDKDTFRIKHAINSLVDYFIKIDKIKDIPTYLSANYGEALRNNPDYSFYIADYLIMKGYNKEASILVDKVIEKKLTNKKKFYLGKLKIINGDTTGGLADIKLLNNKIALNEIVKFYYDVYQYDSLIKYSSNYLSKYTSNDMIIFEMEYALFWKGASIKTKQIGSIPYTSRLEILKLIQQYDRSKDISLFNLLQPFLSDNDLFTKAYAMYLAGLIKYDSGNYKDALNYLLKIKYIYNRADIIVKSLKICSDILSGNNDNELDKIVNEIKNYEKKTINNY